MAEQIRERRGTAAEWAADNPVLALGEPGYETDTRKTKHGDGATAWNSLPYDYTGTSGGGGSTVTMDSDGTLTVNGAAFEVAMDAETAHLTGTQTITGATTFSAPVTVATPTASGHATTKGYVDNAVAGAAGAVSSVAGQTGAVTGSQILADSSVSAALAAKADSSTVTSGLAAKADASTVSTALATKADSSTVTTALATKAATDLGNVSDQSTARTNLGLGSSATMTPTALAADVAFTGNYANKLKTKARTFLAAMPNPNDVYRLYTATTITVGAPVDLVGTATTSITNGVRIRPRLDAAGVGTSGQTVTPEKDPRFRYDGIAVGKVANYGVTGQPGDTERITWPLLTGGSSQNAQWVPKIGWVYSGQTFEILFKTTATTMQYRLTIDGARMTERMVNLTGLVASHLYSIKVDFGAYETHRVDWQTDVLNFGGLYIEPTAIVTRSPHPKRTIATFGDSHVRGANTVGVHDVFTTRMADLLGCDGVYNLAIGGSRYNSAGGAGAGASDFRNRIPDIIAAAPDLLLIYGAFNDAVQTTSQSAQDALQAEVDYCLNAIKTALPDTIVVIGGCHPSGTPTDSGIQRANAAVRLAAAARGVPFIDPLDPLGELSTAPAWAASTIYAAGVVVQNAGVVYQCVTGHTSTTTFDATMFRATSWIYGTGRQGTLAGNGNADIMTSTDAIHMTQTGHSYFERRMSAAVIRALENLAA